MADTAYTDNVTVVYAAWLNDVNTVTYSPLTSVAGTNTVTATGPSTLSAYAANQRWVITPAATNTAAVTLAITPSGGSVLAARNVYRNGAACVGGELVSGVPAILVDDGTQLNIINPHNSETTWTPAITFGTPGDLSASYSAQVGYYNRDGNQVAAHFRISLNDITWSSASGNLRISGLPAAAKNTTGLQPTGSMVYEGISLAGYTHICPVALPSQTYMEFQMSGAGVDLASVSAGCMSSSHTVIVQGTILYQV